MSKPYSGNTADVQGKNGTGITVDRSSPTDNSTTSLSFFSREATARSTTRVPDPTTVARGHRTSNDNLRIPEPWMETVTPGKFDKFQAVVFLAIEHIISQPEYQEHPFSKQWNSLKRRSKMPMTQNITWRNVKILLGLKDIFEYTDFLQRCPDLRNYIRFQSSVNTTRGFDFGVYDYSNIIPEDDGKPTAENTLNEYNQTPQSTPSRDPTTVQPVIPSVTPKTVIHELAKMDNVEEPSMAPAQLPDFPPLTQLSDDTDESYVDVVKERENPKLTPKQANTTSKTMDESVTTMGTMDNLSLPQDIVWGPDAEHGFRAVHYRVFESIEIWMLQDEAKKTPFYQKWRKAIYEGLTALNTWEKVAKIFKLSYLRDYVTLMYECPRIRERYELTWDYFDNTIRCKELVLPETEEVINDVSKLNALHGRMKEMAFNFESTMQQFSQRIDDINTSLTGCERSIVEQLNRVSDRLAGKVSHHMNTLTDYATSSIEKFTRQTTNITEKSMVTIQNYFTKAQKDHSEQMEAKYKHFEKLLEQRIEQAVEHAIEQALQEIYTSADEAVESVHEQGARVLENLSVEKGNWKTEPAKPSKLFPNVDINYINKKHYSPAVHSDGFPMDDRQDRQQYDAPVWSKDGPQPDRAVLNQHPAQTQQYAGVENLPIVDNHSVLKRVMLPYPGREQSYTWYLQVKSNLHQYGVYLIGMDDFQKDKSLCPTEMFSIPITISRYHTMKSTLYHFLAQRHIIPPEYNDLRNIINRNALQTDGYRVLYDIMERIHPRLDPDATFDAPISKDYADIHEYYLYVTAYFMHEEYSGRPYTTRQKINKFIKGLDRTYEYAISKVRGHLESWQVSDPIVPDNLKFENLPNKIDKYMEEVGGLPVIHRFERRGVARKDKTDKTDHHANEESSRQYVDAKCPLCQTHGHTKYQCDRMAIHLHLIEAAKMVDEKLKTKIIANFAEVDAKRRAKRVAKMKGTVRQLYQAGDFQAGEQLMDKYLAEHKHDGGVQSDSESSTSS